MSHVFQTGVHYQNLLEQSPLEEGKPAVDAITAIGDAQVKRVALKAGTELKSHKTEDHVFIVWLRGKASFNADGGQYVMHPGSTLEMAGGMPHGVVAETDCVFLLLKFRCD